jgi:hypothetical protein
MCSAISPRAESSVRADRADSPESAGRALLIAELRGPRTAASSRLPQSLRGTPTTTRSLAGLHSAAAIATIADGQDLVRELPRPYLMSLVGDPLRGWHGSGGLRLGRNRTPEARRGPEDRGMGGVISAPPSK